MGLLWYICPGKFHHRETWNHVHLPTPPICTLFGQAWHAWAVMNFEAVLHYKHQNQGRDEKKKLRHASDASANSEASNSDSEVDSTDHSPVPSPGQKKVNEVRVTDIFTHYTDYLVISSTLPVTQRHNVLIRTSVCGVHAGFRTTHTSVLWASIQITVFLKHHFKELCCHTNTSEA